MTKVLHTGDWHGDKSTAGVARFDDVARAVQQTVEVAKRERVDLYCFTGDLTDPDSGSVVLRCVDLAVRAAMDLHRAGIESAWIAGNHDVAEDGQGTTTLSPLRSLPVQVFEKPAVVSYGDLELIALPYPSLSTAYDPAEFLRTNRVLLAMAKKVVVAGHMTALEEIPDGEETLEMPRGRGVPFPLEQCGPSWLLLNGHWHDRQTYQAGGRQVHICGALARLTFGEERNVPSFTIHEI